MIFEMVCDLLSQCVGCDPARITPATVILQDLEAAPSDLADVMLGLEEALPITWEEEDLEKMETVADLVRYLEAQID